MQLSFNTELYFIYIIAFILVILEQFIKRKYIEIILYFFCVFIILFTAFRDPVSDTIMYTDVFNQMPDIWNLINGESLILDKFPLELGYLYLNSIVQFIVSAPQLLFFIIATISISAYYFLFRKYSPYIALSFFIYLSLLYIFREIVQIRNGVACALVLYSVKFLYEQKIKKYILIILIAASFHLTAVVGFSFYFINKILWTRKKILLVLFFGLIVTQIEWIYQVMEILGNMGILYYRIAKYQGDVVAQQEVTLVKYLLYCFILAYVGLNNWGNRTKGSLENLLLGILVFGVLIQGSFHEFRELADRISSLSLSVLFLLIPIYLKYTRWKYIILIAILIILPFYFYRTVQWIYNPLQ